MPHSSCSAQIVGEPILAAAGFQPALAGHEGSCSREKAAWKGGCRQDCLPHDKCRTLPAHKLCGIELKACPTNGAGAPGPNLFGLTSAQIHQEGGQGNPSLSLSMLQVEALRGSVGAQPPVG